MVNEKIEKFPPMEPPKKFVKQKIKKFWGDFAKN